MHMTESSMLCCLPWSTWATLAVIASNSAAKRVFPAPLGFAGRPGACEGAAFTPDRVDVFHPVPYGSLAGALRRSGHLPRPRVRTNRRCTRSHRHGTFVRDVQCR